MVKTMKRRDSMKERLTIRKRGQVTLPKSILDRFDLDEGDSLDIEIDERGEISVVPMIQIPASQRWFWTEEWQKGERETDEDIEAGRVSGPFDNAEDLIKSLKSDEWDEFDA